MDKLSNVPSLPSIVNMEEPISPRGWKGGGITPLDIGATYEDEEVCVDELGKNKVGFLTSAAIERTDNISQLLANTFFFSHQWRQLKGKRTIKTTKKIKKNEQQPIMNPTREWR